MSVSAYEHTQTDHQQTVGTLLAEEGSERRQEEGRVRGFKHVTYATYSVLPHLTSVNDTIYNE